MPAAPDHVDVVVVGGGIAGASTTYHVARDGLRVVLLERESELGTHSTARSAATLVPGYGGPANDQFTNAGLAFLHSCADGLAAQPLLTPRPLLWVHPSEPTAPTGDLAGAEEISVDEAVDLCPQLRAGAIAQAAFQPGGYDIDVAELLAAYLRGARSHKAVVCRSSAAVRLERHDDHWAVESADFTVRAPVVVNAANAWADQVAIGAGLGPAGLRPLKRTAFVSPVSTATAGLPLVLSADHTFYFKPDVDGMLLCSRADETPSEPCDPRPDEVDVAYALDRINAHTTFDIRSVQRAWAGLRVFTADRQPLVEPHADDPTFIWCAGLGGTGVQTSVGVGSRIAEFATVAVG